MQRNAVYSVSTSVSQHPLTSGTSHDAQDHKVAFKEESQDPSDMTHCQPNIQSLAAGL